MIYMEAEGSRSGDEIGGSALGNRWSSWHGRSVRASGSPSCSLVPACILATMELVNRRYG